MPKSCVIKKKIIEEIYNSRANCAELRDFIFMVIRISIRIFVLIALVITSVLRIMLPAMFQITTYSIGISFYTQFIRLQNLRNEYRV